MSRIIIVHLLHLVVDFHLWLYDLGQSLLGNKRSKTEGPDKTILLTGTFYSENWIMNHLGPLALSRHSKKVWIVCTFPIPDIDNVTWIKPNERLSSIFGSTPVRLLTFTICAIRYRPDIIGGFHLLINALLAQALASCLGSTSLYVNGGGPRETLGGGYLGNGIFEKLGGPDHSLERKLFKAVSHCDLVITMGKNVIEYFKSHGVSTHFEVVPGGIDSSLYSPNHLWDREYDLIIVGRLVHVKRIDLLIEAIQVLAQQRSQLKAVIVGVGELEEDYKHQVRERNLEAVIEFAGFQSNVTEWLNRSRIFVLTSDSEGLSLALMEAMMCGLPAIVSDVGELGELVVDGLNGCLVKDRTPENFATAFDSLLSDPEKWKDYSHAASDSARQFDVNKTAKKWDRILASL